MASALSGSPKQNQILAALAPAELARLEPSLELVPLPANQVLWEAGTALQYVYFPTAGLVSQSYTSEEGVEAEVALIGSDGLVGVSLVAGNDSAAYRAVVCGAGQAYRFSAEAMRWELAQEGGLQRLCLRYFQALMVQMAQVTVCSRTHSVEQQLCRWLLFSFDHLHGDELNRTQERIGDLLGLCRTSISDAASRLQAAGLIHYTRGHISILDRAGLEAQVCGCYHALKREQERVLEPPPEVSVMAGEPTRPNPATLRQRAEAHRRTIHPPASASVADAVRRAQEGGGF
jgi:CRP-like cAMP-binding protein